MPYNGDEITIGAPLLAQPRRWRPGNDEHGAVWDLKVLMLSQPLPMLSNMPMDVEQAAWLADLVERLRKILDKHGPETARPARGSETSIAELLFAVMCDELVHLELMTGRLRRGECPEHALEYAVTALAKLRKLMEAVQTLYPDLVPTAVHAQ